MAFLEAILSGEDEGLEDALEGVATAAEKAAEGLERAEDSLEEIRSDLEAVEKMSESTAEAMRDVGESAAGAASGISREERSAQDLTLKAGALTVVLDEATAANFRVAGSSEAAAEGIDEVGDQASQASSRLGRLEAAILGESASAEGGALANQQLAQSLDNVEDEAEDATRSMAGTASMAELLSLQSSALSINVGAFTIALRNLTTQVPLLVATLGNLATAFAAVNATAAGVALGGFGVAIGGAIAEVEALAGKTATLQEKLQAAQAVGREFMSMLREGIAPLVEMQGSMELFRSLLEEIATTVRVFSQSIADSFRAGPLRNAISNISDAWMNNIEQIGDAMEQMVADLGVPLSELLAEGIRALDDFIEFATRIGQRMGDILSIIDGHVQRFIASLMNLGLAIGEGVAPVLAAFLDVVGDVADSLVVTNREINQFRNTAEGAGMSIQQAADHLSGFRIQTIATAVEITALLLAINRLAGIFGAILQPAALAIGHLGSIAFHARSLSEAFLRVTGNIVAGMSSMSSGFGRLATAMASIIPMAKVGESNLLDLADSMRGGRGAAARFVTALSNVRLGVSRLPAVLDRAIDKFIDLASPLGVAAVGMADFARQTAGFVAGIFRSSSALGALALASRTFATAIGEADRRISSARSELAEMVGVERVAAERTDELADEFEEAGVAAALSSDEIEDVQDRLRELNDDGVLAEMTLSQLEDEIEDVGIDSALAKEAVDELGDEMTELSIKAGIAASATTLLSDAIGALGSVSATVGAVIGAMGAAVVAFVGIVGTLAAALMLLGESGKSAGEIIAGLKETVTNVMNIITPLIVESGNTMIDIFNSLMAPVNAFMSGIRDVGEALGIIEEGASGSSSAMEVLKAIVDALIPVVDGIGDAFRRVFSGISRSIRETLTGLASFLEDANLESTVDDLFSEMDEGLDRTISLAASLAGVLIGVVQFMGDVAGFAKDISNIFLELAGTDLGELFKGLLRDAAIFIAKVNAGIAALESFVEHAEELMAAAGPAIAASLDVVLAVLRGNVEKIPKILENAMVGVSLAIADTVARTWNQAIGGETVLTLSVGGAEAVSVTIPELQANNFTASLAGDVVPPGATGTGGMGESRRDESDLFGGVDLIETMIGEAREAAFGGAPGRVEYNEGDVNNRFRQNISANPEDEAQISRIAKDAMEEANAFARRQQGGQ